MIANFISGFAKGLQGPALGILITFGLVLLALILWAVHSCLPQSWKTEFKFNQESYGFAAVLLLVIFALIVFFAP